MRDSTTEYLKAVCINGNKQNYVCLCTTTDVNIFYRLILLSIVRKTNITPQTSHTQNKSNY